MIAILKRLLPVFLLSLAFVFAGCTTTPEPYEYEDERELKKGPGLFSGEKGTFDIYNSGEKEPAKTAEENTSAEEKKTGAEGQEPSGKVPDK